ncbi:hypothetical protein CUMW_259230 [Citrus unshiu]|uniref:Uncharacterized protein n=1 Tax=Citrus unshiu TaxID=55188 RepID=A0A2H5QT46_CITUN|nr:hypothetical protein CUMW_259230 [Citrus unshiu]
MQEVCSETGLTEEEVDKSVLWKRARQMKNGGYHPDVEPVIKKISPFKLKQLLKHQRDRTYRCCKTDQRRGQKSCSEAFASKEEHKAAREVQRNKISLLQLFGTMCEAKMSDQEWIPYLLDDGVFQLEEIRAHIGRRDCSAVLSMDATGVNVIELYFAMLYASILPRKRGVKPFGFVRPGLVSLGEERNPTASFDLRARGVPQQPASSVVCGFYVMRFMKDLINYFSILMNNVGFSHLGTAGLVSSVFLAPLVLLELLLEMLLEMNYVVAFVHVGRNDSVVGFLMLLELN